jgi:hypothetical protein
VTVSAIDESDLDGLCVALQINCLGVIEDREDQERDNRSDRISTGWFSHGDGLREA